MQESIKQSVKSLCKMNRKTCYLYTRPKQFLPVILTKGRSNMHTKSPTQCTGLRCGLLV